jgi:hypothetical protein
MFLAGVEAALAPAPVPLVVLSRGVEMKLKQSLIFYLILFCLPTYSHAQAWSGIIDPSRAVDWSKAGVPGGIPARATNCAMLAPNATSATITAAIKSCRAGGTVFLTAGTYNLSAGINFGHTSNVTLRGAGANQTFLVFTGDDGCGGLPAAICLGSQDINYWGGPSNLANWTAGYAPGTTSITLSSVANLSVGKVITLDQADDTADSGDIFLCYAPAGACSTNGDNGGFLRPGRSQEQLVTVTSISGGACPCTVGITPGIYMPNWASGKSPQAWWATSPIAKSGVENLSIDSTNSGAYESVELFNCNACWVSGIRSIDPSRSHVLAWQSPHTTVQNSYFFSTANQTSSSYGVEFNNASDSLLQNNIGQQLSAPWVTNGTCSGCVLAYNFDINNIYNSNTSGTPNYTYQQQGFYPHTVGDDHILAEGNEGAGMYSDNFHGTHHFQTAFRNAWNGFQPNNGNTTINGIAAVMVLAYSRFYNLVGNVLGTTAGPYTFYQVNTANLAAVGSNFAVEIVGIGDGVPNDPNVSRTIMNWGNYDTVTGAVRWCGNASDPGWSAICGNTSEVPSGIANYANPVPASTTLPASFYLSSPPLWWPGTKPWPPIGPDVSGGNISGIGGHAYTIPAADCYSTIMAGPSNGTGPILSFNASNCYTSPTNLPQAPTNLTGTVN